MKELQPGIFIPGETRGVNSCLYVPLSKDSIIIELGGRKASATGDHLRKAMAWSQRRRRPRKGGRKARSEASAEDRAPCPHTFSQVVSRRSGLSSTRKLAFQNITYENELSHSCLA